eukprot:CAMPEP_0178435030 /NCGR_PEP_ID=MMETSP0689_2-20121128/33721_1 /TAXON_ID=160604 /ORGANISM="Amphidinium massartii, Strain CS-259" /LENGTH=826 /DNA_ID=CAMNT_0020057097 /DNA_START=59 /DNA_END=2539 /DNA_ORIENTATION=+
MVAAASAAALFLHQAGKDVFGPAFTNVDALTMLRTGSSCSSTDRPACRAQTRATTQATLHSPKSGFRGMQVSKRTRKTRVPVPDEALTFNWDKSYAAEDVANEADAGEVIYLGIGGDAAVPLLDAPDGDANEEVLVPGDAVAVQIPEGSGYAKLLDGRGWLDIDREEVEEIHPFVAKAMKPSGVSKDDAAALAYLTPDLEDLPPLAEHLPLPRRVAQRLESQGISKASPIQEAVFHRIHRGESLCIQSQTGSGKTLAMLLPLLTAMSEESTWGFDGDKIVVVTSERELAVQLFSAVDSMGFFPQGQGNAVLCIDGNVPPAEACMNANVIIGTPNELGGVLQRDDDIIRHFHGRLRAIVMDEVDAYTTAPKLFASKWAIKKKRRVYNEKKALMIDVHGTIEWFMKKGLFFSRRRDFQVLAASATMNRNMARKLFRLLRWDPLGRWFRKPPPLVRPAAMMAADWQAVPRMPSLPLHIQHRYVDVVPNPDSDVVISNRHYTRKGFGEGGLRRIKVRNARGQAKGAIKGIEALGHAVKPETAAAILDGLHDALKSRGEGSTMVIVTRTVGVTVRDLVRQLHKWGFHEAEAMQEALWGEELDDEASDALKYNWDGEDHSVDLAERHQELNDRLLRQEHKQLRVASSEWKQMEERKANGETTSPILVGFEGISRGLHFDGVSTVYMLGLPRKPATYLHLAGRVGRLGQKGGKVISVVPKGSVKVLDAWRNQIGPGVQILPEEVERIRSTNLWFQYPEEDEWYTGDVEQREHPKKVLRLLPEGQQPFEMPGSTSQPEAEEELEEEPVPLYEEADRDPPEPLRMQQPRDQSTQG